MPDELTYERAARRIARSTLVLGAIGSIVAFAIGGWRAGAGFLTGSAVSWLNFRWLKRTVDSLGGSQKPRGAASMVTRYLLLVAAGYVIFRFARISLPAVLAGVLVLTAAVFMEVAFEIAYARK
jgi:hypothetical protein